MRDNKVYIQTFTRVLSRFYCDLWRTTVLRGEHSLQPHLSGVCQKPKTLLNDNELHYNYNSTVYTLEV